MAEDLERLQRTIDQIIQAARTDVRRARRESIDVAQLLGECADDARERHGLDEGRGRWSSVPESARAARRRRAAARRVPQPDRQRRPLRGRARSTSRSRVRPVSARRLEIEFADRGVGIPASALDRVFQRFSRLPQEAVRAAHGLGLGLTSCATSRARTAASVRAESDGEGKGSRFILTLPGHVDDARILLVEDEEHLARGLAFNLEAEGYRVEVAERGESRARAARRPGRAAGRPGRARRDAAGPLGLRRGAQAARGREPRSGAAAHRARRLGRHRARARPGRGRLPDQAFLAAGAAGARAHAAAARRARQRARPSTSRRRS